MSRTKQEKNNALVHEAFDTLFNKRDYLAAERYWSPDYIQHSAHIAPGRGGLFNLIKSLPPTLIFFFMVLGLKRLASAVQLRPWPPNFLLSLQRRNSR
jgi:hypothetical protein